MGYSETVTRTEHGTWANINTADNNWGKQPCIMNIPCNDKNIQNVYKIPRNRFSS